MRWGQDGGEHGPGAGSSSTDRDWDLHKKPQLSCFLLLLDNSHWGVRKESALFSTWNHVGTQRGSIILMNE